MENKKLINDIKNNPVELITLGFVEDAIKLTHSSYIKEKIAYNFIKKGWIDLGTSQFSKSLKSFNRALKIFSKREDLDGYLLSLHGIASIYNSCNQYSNALEIYTDILNRLETKKSDLRFITLKDIAHTYYLWGAYSESVNYLKIAMDIIKNEKSVYRKIYINYNLGKAYLKLGKFGAAQESLFMTLTLCDANSINYKISETLTQLGNIFRKKQNYIRAESFHIRALQYAKSAKDYSAHSNVLLNLGSLMFYSGNCKKSIQFISSALDEIDHVENKYIKMIKAYHYLFMSYKDMGDINEAIKYLQKSMVIKEREKERISKLQFDLLNIQLKFSIKSESFIVKNIFDNEISLINTDRDEKNLSELAGAIYNGVKNILNFSNLSLYTLKHGSNSLIQTIMFENEKCYIKEIDASGTPAATVIRQDKELILYDRSTSNSNLEYNQNKLTRGMNSFIILPIKRGDLVVGAVSIEDEEKNKYTQYDLNTLKTISAYISLSIENMRIKGEVDSLNTLMDNDTIIIESTELDKNKPQKDRESGLPYKALFIELLNQAIKGTKRNKSKIALLTIVIDMEFENRGTFLSEDLIIGEHSITSRIMENIRAEDILGKECDDTYLLAIKMDNIRGCRTIAKKLVSQIKKPIFTENQKIQPKVKIGITIYPDNYLTIKELIEKSKKCALKISKDNIVGFQFSESIHNITSID